MYSSVVQVAGATPYWGRLPVSVLAHRPTYYHRSLIAGTRHHRDSHFLQNV